MKSDKSIIADLPDKTEVKTFCALSKRQAALYQQTVNFGDCFAYALAKSRACPLLFKGEDFTKTDLDMA